MAGFARVSAQLKPSIIIISGHDWVKSLFAQVLNLPEILANRKLFCLSVNLDEVTCTCRYIVRTF